MLTSTKKRNIISDKLCIEKTGHDLEHWFAVLDKKGAQKKSHADIFSEVSKTRGLEPLGEWNQNLLTTTYEWNRGLKGRGEKKDGFEISVSKTVAVPITTLYDAFLNKPIRNKWLPNQEVEFRKTTENRSARITWSDGHTSLSVDFYEKGPGKSQVVVQHQKISGQQNADKLKKFWSATLEDLKQLLEK